MDDVFLHHAKGMEQQLLRAAEQVVFVDRGGGHALGKGFPERRSPFSELISINVWPSSSVTGALSRSARLRAVEDAVTSACAPV